MRVYTKTRPEQTGLHIVLKPEEAGQLQVLTDVVYKLAHQAGFKRTIPADLVPFVDVLHSKFDYGDPRPKVTEHTSTHIEVEDE